MLYTYVYHNTICTVSMLYLLEGYDIMCIWYIYNGEYSFVVDVASDKPYSAEKQH